MPSPFPGMDPYLEARSLWKRVHDMLIVMMLEPLQPLLLPRYIAVLEGRLLLRPLDQPAAETSLKSRFPDVVVEKRLPAPPERGGGGVLVAAPPLEATQSVWVDEPELRTWHSFLEIRSVEDRSVVTVIELLSPWNKSPGEGQHDYREKQRALLLSDTNLVEIDLLRGGSHTVAFRPGSLPPSDYRVCTHRIARRDGFEVIPFSVRDPLPRIAIPLRGEEPDVVLDLPAVFRRVYDTGAFFAQVDYSRPPDPPLSAPDEAWANDLVRASRRPEGEAASNE
jgi:uncharacterized protein DUF4058